jgi:hypothetical protein
MASIRDIVGNLRSTKEILDKARTFVESAGKISDEMISGAEAMDLMDVAAGVRTVKAEIETADAEVANLDDRLSELIAAAERIEAGSGVPAQSAQSAAQPETSSSTEVESSAVQASELKVPPSAPSANQSQDKPWTNPDTGVEHADPGGQKFVLPQASEPSLEVRDLARQDPEPLSWRQKLGSSRTASIASAAAGGVATTTATALGHLPVTVQAAVNSVLALMTVWQVHKSNPKHKDDSDG